MRCKGNNYSEKTSKKKKNIRFYVSKCFFSKTRGVSLYANETTPLVLEKVLKCVGWILVEESWLFVFKT